MSISSAHITGVSGVDLTRLAMHRGAHLMSATKLGLPAEFTNIFYQTDDVAVSGDLKSVIAAHIGRAEHASHTEPQHIPNVRDSGRVAFLG